MNLVDTQSTKRTKVARTHDGRVDFDAYHGCEGTITTELGLVVPVKIVGARARFGHLDLLVTPVGGNGERWYERKNVALVNDPADSTVGVGL